MRFRFESTEVDTDRFELRVDGARVRIEPQVFEVLAHLVANHGRLVPKTELLDEIWGDRFVSDSALSSRIRAARAAIGDDGRAQRCIRTVHGRGFQFVAPVELSGGSDDVAPAAMPPDDDLHQSIRFVSARDGFRLAMATIGDGTTMIKAANWLTHVEHDWRSPVWHHWLRDLGNRFQLVRYDARGCGLSDRDLDGIDLHDPDVWADDLECVVEAAGADRFVLLGMSQGAVPAIVYALRHPERVSHLVLYGAYARGMRLRGDAEAAEADTLLQLIRAGWGGTNPAFRTVFTMNFMPGASSEQMKVFNDLQVESSDAASALQLESAFHELDVGALAARLQVPTLVMHGRADRATPYGEGRRLAAVIPGAEFVTLDSENHILVADEPAWPEFLDHVDRFVAT